jgi:cytochrome c oxidase subunit 1
MYQHIFWFFGHPEVYIMILPAFGIFSEIIPTFSRKRLFGYTSMVYATASIAILSFIVWAHHMFTTGMPVTGAAVLHVRDDADRGAHGVKIFNWIATMWQGSLTFETPMLFAVGFIFVFTIGRLHRPDPGRGAARHPAARHLLRGGALPLRAGGRLAVRAVRRLLLLGAQVDRPHVRRARQDALLAVADLFNVTFFPMHFLGLAGMPRRYADYAAVHRLQHDRHDRGLRLRPVAAVFLWAIIKCIKGGAKATDQVWEHAQGLEWTVPEPGALPHLRDAADRQVRRARAPTQWLTAKKTNLRTALVLLSIAAVFFAGVILKRVLFG